MSAASMPSLAGLCVAVGVLSAVVTWLMTRHAARLGFIDSPNERSLHAAVKPRAGGLGFVLFAPIATLVAANLWVGPLPSPVAVLMAAAVSLALVSLADDRWGLSIGVRLLAQVAAALALIFGGGVLTVIPLPGAPVSLGTLAAPATLLWLVAFTNIYNFMDGSDGLAASQAIVAALAMSLLAAIAAVPIVTIAMATLAAAVAGFLAFNWPPARIFMGDVGSTFLGFTFAGWAVLSADAREALLPLGAWLTVLSPFLFDGLLTMTRRQLRGQRIYHAHREHMYQRLVRNGWSHRAVALLYTGLGIAASSLMLAHYAAGLPAAVFIALLAAVLASPVILTKGLR